MPIQLVVVAKPELFERGQLEASYHRFFRILFSYSFPSDIKIESFRLVNLAKQIFIAHMRTEMGDQFFNGNAPIAPEFFDRWWTINFLDDASEDERRICEDVRASAILDALDKRDRDQIFLMQSDDVRALLKRLLEVDDRPQGPQADGLIYAATDYFMPFPKPETVFAEDVETHLKYLLPLATVSLKHINPTWQGQIHFVQPIEPYDGCIGERTASHHSSLCRENWVGYRIDERGRYALATDWDYFLLSNLNTRPDIQVTPVEKQQVRDHYERAKRSYATNRNHFKTYHALHPSYAFEKFGGYRDRDRLELVSQLGGKPGWGNWAGIGDWPLSERACDEADEFPDETYPLPQAEDGTDFSYIGWLHSFVYVETSSCNLELFYHPEHRLALTTFDWS